jgi:hypothetical protein
MNVFIEEGDIVGNTLNLGVTHKLLRAGCATKWWRCTGGGRDVRDADTAGAVRPRGTDGNRPLGRWLRGALPEVRDRGSGAGDLRRSAASAVGAGAAQAKIALSPRSSPSTSPLVHEAFHCFIKV